MNHIDYRNLIKHHNKGLSLILSYTGTVVDVDSIYQEFANHNPNNKLSVVYNGRSYTLCGMYLTKDGHAILIGVASDGHHNYYHAFSTTMTGPASVVHTPKEVNVEVNVVALPNIITKTHTFIEQFILPT